jgi:hypothetical protein
MQRAFYIQKTIIMQSFKLNSGETFALSKLNLDDISIRKISAADNNIRHLLYPMRLTADYPDGKMFSDLFYPQKYINVVMAKQAITNDFKFVIRNCKCKKMQIQGATEKFSLSISYEKASFLIDKLIINVTEQSDGVAYSLPPNAYFTIKKIFPQAFPVRSVLMREEVKTNFEWMHGPVTEYVIPALTGINEELLMDVRTISFVDAKTNREISNTYK